MTTQLECQCGFRWMAGDAGASESCPRCGTPATGLSMTARDRTSAAPRSSDDATVSHAPSNASADTRTSFLTSSPEQISLPELPGYVVEDEIGRGGMGVVYRARELALNRPVALKVLLAGAHASDRDLARFRTEAEAAAAVVHPNVVRVYAAGEHDGLPFLSLELVPGGSLAGRLGAGPLSPDEAARVVEAVARGVQAANDRGILHRDLKPANVLFDERSEPKVADFGLAKLGETELTASGAIMGTPAYMAPEQARGSTKQVGPATDVWAVGAILYECLTGRPPFRGQSSPDTLRLVCDADPLPVRTVNPGAPRDLETIALKCLEKDPARRFASVGAVADDLAAWRRGDPVSARPRGPVSRAVRRVRRYRGPVYVSAGALVAAAVVFAVYPDKHTVEKPPAHVSPAPEPEEPADNGNEGAIGKVQIAAARMNSMNNLKQLTIATHNMEVTYGRMPPPAIYHPKTGQPLLSWRVAYLPFIDSALTDLYKQFKLDEPWDSANNLPLLEKMPKVFETAGSKAPKGHTHYQVFVGPGTIYDPTLLKPGKPFGKFGPSFLDVTDGTSQTLLMAEGAKAVPWTKPEDLEVAPDRPLPALGGVFEGGYCVAAVDGRVVFASHQVSEKTLRAAITPRGSDIVGPEWPDGAIQRGTPKK